MKHLILLTAPALALAPPFSPPAEFHREPTKRTKVKKKR